MTDNETDGETWTERRPQATVKGETRSLDETDLREIEQRRPPGGA